MCHQALGKKVYGEPLHQDATQASLDVEGMSTGAAVISVVHWIQQLKLHQSNHAQRIQVTGLPSAAATETYSTRVCARGSNLHCDLAFAFAGLCGIVVHVCISKIACFLWFFGTEWESEQASVMDARGW